VSDESCSFGGFSRLAEAGDCAHLAGSAQAFDAALPVPLVLVPGAAADLHGAVGVLCQCSRMCQLLLRQRHLVPHADFHAAALVQHVFMNVLPVPLPAAPRGAALPEACFWRREPMSSEAQALLAQELAKLVRHFAAASLSLAPTPHLHAARLLTVGAAVAILDAATRQVPSDAPALFSRVYSGELQRGARCQGFGLAPFALAEEMRELSLREPRAVWVRARLLDYLASVRPADGRSVLGFADMRPSPGDRELVQRLLLLGGFARGRGAAASSLPQYLCGEHPEFLATFPCLAALRDVSFLLRWLCVPVPLDRRRRDGQPWQPADVELRWQYVAGEDRLKVEAFQQRPLSLCREREQGGLWAAMARLGGTAQEARRWPSPAAASSAARCEVKSEDDTLHMTEPCTFGERLTLGDAERLLAYLTVPYLRVPLCLQFFNDRSRFGALAHPPLQAMLDAVLFEPGSFAEEDGGAEVAQVPAARAGPDAAAAYYATAAGRFVHELAHSPGAVLHELDGIFKLAMERDTPAYLPGAAAVLYAVRLWVRAAALAAAVARDSSEGAREPARGFACGSAEAAKVLGDRASSWGWRLRLEAVPTLERWCSRAMEEAAGSDVACAIWLHLALIYRWGDELSARGVSTLICAEVYVNANLKMGQDADGDNDPGKTRSELLGFADTEIFELFHATRPRIYEWLRREGGGRDRILEHVVATVASSQVAQGAEDAVVLGRRWVELEDFWDGSGRFATSAPAAVSPELADESFSNWLAASTDAAPVEVNINIGQLQFRQRTVTPVPEDVLALPEFREVFPQVDAGASRLMWALVECSQNRERYRFAGSRYEFRLWRKPVVEPSEGIFCRSYPRNKDDGEDWIEATLRAVPELQELLHDNGTEWKLPRNPQTGHMAQLRIVCGCSQDMEVQYGDDYGYVDPHLAGAVKELDIFRETSTPQRAPVVHVYEMTMCGPRSVRTQVFTSDAAWSYAAFDAAPGAGASCAAEASPAASTPASVSRARTRSASFIPIDGGPAPSVEIVHEDTGGESVLVPQRFLVGTLPDLLLSSFDFWRPRHGRLVGKMKPAARRQASSGAALVVELSDGGGAARVHRVTLSGPSRVEEARQLNALMHEEGEETARIGASTLVDLVRAPPNSTAWEVAGWALQLDDLSHVLVWTHDWLLRDAVDSHEGRRVDAVEFPRLGLTFTSSGEDGALRCDQHGGLSVARSPVGDQGSLLRLVRQIPRFVLLEDDVGELYVLVSVADRPRHTRQGAVELVRNDPEWMAGLRAQHRNQLFSVHSSHEFLTATTRVAELYLLLLHVLHGSYSSACAIAMTCAAAGPHPEFEEERIWEEVTTVLRNERCIDAAVLRLKIVLQLDRHRQSVPDGWDPGADLMIWTLHGSRSLAGQLLTPAEDAALLALFADFASVEGSAMPWELRVRSELYERILPHGSGAAVVDAVVPRTNGVLVPGPNLRGRTTLEDSVDESVLSLPPPSEVDIRAGLFDVEALPTQEFSWPTGDAAYPWLLRRLPLQLPADFLTLYELITSSRSVWLRPGDAPEVTGELLACLLSPQELEKSPALAGLVRMLEQHPDVAKKLPRCRGRDPVEFGSELVAALQSDSVKNSLRAPGTALGRPVHEGATSAAEWAIRRDEGRWMLCGTGGPEAPERATSGVHSARSCGSRASRLETGSLTNAQAESMIATLESFGDSRLPSMEWDFDCGRRALRNGAAVDDDWPGGSCGSGPSELWHICAELQGLPGMQELPLAQLPALASRPLLPVGLDSYVSFRQQAPRATAFSSVFSSLELEGCRMQATASGRELLRRLRQDIESLGQETTEPSFLGITAQTVTKMLACKDEVQNLLGNLDQLTEVLKMTLAQDRKDMLQAIRRTKELAGGQARVAQTDRGAQGDVEAARWAQQLGQLGGSCAALEFQDIMRILLFRGGLRLAMPHTAQLLSEQDVADVATGCLLALLLSARTVVCKRCIGQLGRLRGLLISQVGAENRGPHQESDRSHECALVECAQQAARELSTRQFCVDGTAYDPRLLCFEFVSQVVLREKQVSLVRTMVQAVEEGRSLVHQMLMGEGKTTVVTPLLVLLTATAERASIVCCPAALLEFTCRVLRERLRAALWRPVHLFEFSRSSPVSESLCLQLLHARQGRAVLCASPSSLKSLVLRLLLAVHEIDVQRGQEEDAAAAQKRSWRIWRRQPSHSEEQQERLAQFRLEARVLARCFRFMAKAVLTLDELDLLMHPLRSELHWPLGEQQQLDFTAAPGSQGASGLAGGASTAAGLHLTHSHVLGSQVGARWQVAFHLLDGLFCCQLPPGPAAASLGGQGAAARVLDRIRGAVRRGLEEKCLQASPHLALLSREFYTSELRPLLAEWMLIWLRHRHPWRHQDRDLLAYLCGAPGASERLRDLGDQRMKALNLARTWLGVLLPHLAGRIHRVHYGLLDEGSPAWNHEPPARRHLAVPFVGKDVPSDTSQFSHPDVQIGLTWLAYRFTGLRHGDFARALRCLCRMHRQETEVAPRFRRARKLYCAWVSAADAHVRGDIDGDARSAMPKDQGQLVLESGAASGAAQHAAGGGQLVPPLEWINVNDEAQVGLVSAVLRASPFLMEYYLHEDIFPQLLLHADTKLSASGQDLGSEIVCGSRLGFSGTPNDLLPRALGRCVYAQGDDARMVGTLTDPAVAALWPANEDWSALSLLELIAAQDPPLSMLIDVGALITGLSNREVAQTLLDRGLRFEAVVFFDPGGEQWLLRRGFQEAVRVAHCTLPPERRFVFYDQVHTTGMDLRHAPSACAAVTLGKDTTFRDFAQGAYRMRGIGRGQRLKVLLTPEVAARIRAEVPAAPGAAPRGEATLDRVCAWLLLQQASGEHSQQQLLRRQCIEHEGRRCAFRQLAGRFGQADLAAAGGACAGAGPARDERDSALDLFRDRVDYTVETEATGTAAEDADGSCSLDVLVGRVQPFLDEAGAAAVDGLRAGAAAGGGAAAVGDGVSAEWQRVLFTEMEQEHSLELFAEQEEEKEEQEEEQMEEVEDEPTVEARQTGQPWKALPPDGPPEPWALACLAKPPGDADPFYPASQFSLSPPKGGEELSASFPQGLHVSRNFHRPGARGQRRLRTPAVVLEWIPDAEALHGGGASNGTTGWGVAEAARSATRLQTTLDALGISERGFNEEDIGVLLSCLGIDASEAEVARVFRAVEGACGTGVPTADDVLKGLWQSHVLEVQPGRHYALLTLAEAEAVRMALHQRGGQDLLPEHPRCRAALRLLRRDPASLSVLDQSQGWQEAPFHWHQGVVSQCALFLGAETHFAHADLESLRRSLHGAKCKPEALRDFFLASYSVRRRPPLKLPLHGVPVARLFDSEKEHAKLQRKSAIREAYARMLDAGLSPEDAFRRLDQDGDGQVSARDLGVPLALSLGMPRQLMLRLFEALDHEAGQGLVTAAQWAQGFEVQGAHGPGGAAHADPVAPPDESSVPLSDLKRISIELVTPGHLLQPPTSRCGAPRGRRRGSTSVFGRRSRWRAAWCTSRDSD
ncbi:unnamed protein product, partial [Prorocentrum cordatum]